MRLPALLLALAGAGTALALPTDPEVHALAARATTQTLLGCYYDYPRLLASTWTDFANNTPAVCAAYCAGKGFKYAGVEYGLQCFCGNTLSTSAKPLAASVAATQCASPCLGDKSTMCGGSWHINVYQVATVAAAPTSSAKPTSTAAAAPTATSNAAATLVTTTIAPAAAATTKALYAHHIVGNTYTYTQSDWATDISLAKGAGIDGFALNMGNVGWEYTSVGYAYAAAAAAGGFKMFFSFDFTAFSCSSASDGQAVAGLMNKYKTSPAQAMYGGKVLVSTFAGDACTFGQGSVAAGWAYVRSLAGNNMYLVPAIFANPSTFGSDTWLDGELNWNSGWPMGGSPLGTSSDTTYMAALGSKGYAAAVSPCFFTYYGPNSYNKDWIYRSDDWLLATRMEQLIGMRNKLAFAEIISWNDFGESHYIGPLAPAQDQPMSTGWTNGMPHTAWLGLIAYYAPAFKTGAYPALTTDSLYLWTRPHSKNATPTRPSIAKPSNWQYTDDKLYAVVLLSAPAVVKITSGANQVTYNLQKGVNKISLASAPGTITGTITRNGATVKHYDSTGAFSYTATPADYNFNYFVASA